MTPHPWQPSASLATLRARAELLNQIRCFFSQQGLLEVETPLLCQAAVTDPHIQAMVLPSYLGVKDECRYLQTSPEFAMKRLLACHGQSLFQLTKAFRQNDLGRKHNPEFTLLEWYQLGADLNGLMDQVEALLQSVTPWPQCERLSYRELFKGTVGLDPLQATISELKKFAASLTDISTLELTLRDQWLDLIFALHIEPQLAQDAPLLLFHYPASQAALARIEQDEYGDDVAARVELFYQGVELANGYYELTDAEEQRQRFGADNQIRSELGLPMMPVDDRLLAAMDQGLPDCAGMALGVDRLLQLLLKKERIAEVMSFDWQNA